MVSRKLVVRGAIVLAVGVAAFLVTPYAFWRDDAGVAFEYGAEELRPMFEGEWRLELAENADASEPAAVLRLSFAWSHKALQARAPGGGGRGWIREAAACSQRSLVRPAHACMDTTELVIDVAVDGVPLTRPGTFVAYGTRFEGGQVTFAHGEQYFSASVDDAGVMRPDASYGRRIGTLTRVR